MAHSLVMGDNKLALLEWVCDHGFQFSRSDIVNMRGHVNLTEVAEASLGTVSYWCQG